MTLPRLIAAAGMLAIACDPGHLDDPDRFKACTIDVEQDIFIPTCGLTSCHDAATMTNGLDLVTAGVATRLKGMSSGTCEMPKEPIAKLMSSKISAMPSCGSQMPLGSPLEAPQVKCINDYLAALGADGGS